MTTTYRPLSQPRHSRGATLIFVLVFLLILTVLGVSALSGATTEERMSYTAEDHNRAFEAADSALSQGEAWIESQAARPTAASCATSCTNAPLVWRTNPVPNGNWFAFDWAGKALDFSLDYSQPGTASLRVQETLTRVAQSPRYVIEEVGPDTDGSLVVGQSRAPRRWYYRITARGTGAQASTTVITQSEYIKTF